MPIIHKVSRQFKYLPLNLDNKRKLKMHQSYVKRKCILTSYNFKNFLQTYNFKFPRKK